MFRVSVVLPALLLAFAGPALADTTLVPTGATWRYLDTGADAGVAWRAPAFDDAAWLSGRAQLGYGDGDEATVVRFGADPNNKHVTTYLRARFDVPNLAAVGSLRLRLLRDDGAVVYLNGTEIRRDNLPAGAIGFRTLATTAIGGADESAFTETQLARTALVAGANTLAVEIHQSAANSSDLGFDLELIGVTPVAAPVPLIAAGSQWRYLDTGVAPAGNWRTSGFNDAAWRTGNAQLGYGDGDEVTVVGFGPNANSRSITTWFRRSFDVADPAAIGALQLRLLRDDGAVVYLNGNEIRRENMPAGNILASTLASAAVADAAERTFNTSATDSRFLVRGANVLAVELHQSAANSSDISFDLELTGVDPAPITRAPYLQQGTPTSVRVRWRSAGPTVGRVRFGSPAVDRFADEAAATAEHEVLLTGLAPDSRYVYSVGTPAAAAVADLVFYTPPPTGSDSAMRIWVVGDSGKANAGQAAVRDAFTRFSGGQVVDAWLMLGDNAYNTGLDAEYQRGLFDMYPVMLRQSALWPAIGNHDTGESTNPAANIPYFLNFSLPTNGEAGGRPSGTEKYYSFDLGDVHFVALDSQTSSRAADGQMLTWLAQDLAATQRTWIVAYWHHPPYSFGSHNSDSSTPASEMRARANPVLEAGGVDLVLTGHCHSYERSYLIDGHYGASGTFTPAMRVNAGDGREGGGGAYIKPRARTPRAGAVYVVAGTGASLQSWSGGSTALNNPTPYPAMHTSIRALGSLVLDVGGGRMDVTFVRETGAIDDQFTMIKR